MRRAALAAFALSLAGCVAGEEVGASGQPIVNGVLEEGRPAVVYLFRGGAACTGAIIAPRVVLTADHCVEGASPGRIRVYVGTSWNDFTAEYRVSAVRRVPGAGGGPQLGVPNDVALLVLASPADVEPMEISRETPTGLVGQTVTAVGYGQTPAGDAGTKFTTTALVERVLGGFIFVEPAVCSGDSGGPLIGPDERIYGVASFIYSPDGVNEPECGTAPGAYNEIHRHLDFIDSVLEETGVCVPKGEEVCDGKDNDCDGVIDEDCLRLGESCNDGSECLGGLCDDTVIGRVCTRECDPFLVETGCDPGFYCAPHGCEGRCLPGSPGELPYGAECTTNTDCASLFCVDPGNGRRTCRQPCRADAGFCPTGEVCAAAVGRCGACVPHEIFAGGHGLGEWCALDGECRGDMVCHESGGSTECASSCADGSECASGFQCRGGFCVRDRRQDVGGVCLEQADCPSGAVCATQGTRRWCTVQCRDTHDCPRGFECAPGGGTMVCAPALALDGERCSADDECVSELCAEGVCTRACDVGEDATCAPGLQCRRTDDGLRALCLPAAAAESGGGCSVTASQGSGAWLAGLLAALALMVVRRR